MLGLIKDQLTEARPVWLIGDKAYDSDPLDAACAELGVAMIAPHRDGRVRPRTQDGRVLRRHRRRWKVERLFTWMRNYRRVVTRYERHFENFLILERPTSSEKTIGISATFKKAVVRERLFQDHAS